MLRICEGKLGERLKALQRRRFYLKDEHGNEKLTPFNPFGDDQLPRQTGCKYEHWVKHEFRQFKRTFKGTEWWIQLAWSTVTFYCAFLVTTFIYLVLLTKKIEDDERNSHVGNIFFSLIQKYGELVTVTDEYYKLRDKVEHKCFKEILDARNDLVEVSNWKNAAPIAALMSTFSYYYAMGNKVGLPVSLNVQLSAQRLLRRRGLLWHVLLLLKFCSSASAINYYYRCYIMGPENRSLHSIPDDNPRLKARLMSAYGGRGLALQRLYSTQHISPDASSLELARQVALHQCGNEGIEADAELIFNPAFYGGVGFRFRNQDNDDNMPGHCYFTSVDNLTKVIEKSVKVDNKNAKKKERAKQKQARESKEQKEKENLARAKALIDALEAKNEDHGAHFGIGKAYASYPWEERLVKATSSNLTRAMLDRLDVLQLLSTITKANANAKESLVSTSTINSYMMSLGKYRRTYSIMTNTADLVERNYETHCLCSYFPFYVGLFPNRK